ncbi:hypothetical protein C8J56DRAFT_970127 [Mycena floridula]|nr:hypothetical protein C8J56DRAFT_970127 [Mycena floridula]
MGVGQQEQGYLPLNNETSNAENDLTAARRRQGRYWTPVHVLLVLLAALVGIYKLFPSLVQATCSHGRSSVQWKPCLEDPSFLCSFIKVPTDYFNASAGITTLAVAKYPTTAPSSERLGSIMTNFGGPGVPGRTALFDAGPRLQKMLGNKHDIIGYDQRGLGRSLPKVDCFGSAAAYQHFQANTVLETTWSIPKDPSSKEGKALMVEQQKAALALEEAQSAICRDTLGVEALRYMSTSTTIRDMEELSRILEGKDAKINFWGGSYGSIVGSYLANMLPEKAGKILIDGIVPADMWANDPYETQDTLRLLLDDSEKTYQWFLDDCFKAGPTRCALAEEDDKSAQDIGSRISTFLTDLQTNPMIVTNTTNSQRPGMLTDGAVRNLLFTTLQMTPMWPVWSSWIASAMKGDGSQIRRFIARPFAPDPYPVDGYNYTETGQGALGRVAISCSDAIPYDSDPETWPSADTIVDSISDIMKDVSPMFGGTVHLMEQHGGCQFWPATGAGPERFAGPWNHTLETPVLIVSNTHDPVTPLKAGRIVKNDFGSSARLLVQEVAGHSYLAPITDCAMKVISDYFTNEIIPVNDETWCKREHFDYFPEPESTMESSSALLSPYLWI